MSRPVKYIARVTVLTIVLIFAPPLSMAEPVIKAGVLKFGTVNWLLDTVQHHGLDKKNGYRLEQLELARRDASSVALLAGEVDTIVADWFWALREVSAGEDLVFHPYSRALGALMVPVDSAIARLSDLKGRKIGVAGGPLDKSWLLVRAQGEAEGAGDLKQVAEPVFAAPPLLSEQFKVGRLDAVLIYWHYAARLEAAGFRRLVGVEEIMHNLGFEREPPLIGFLYRRPKDTEGTTAFAGFRASIDQATKLLQQSDDEWQRLRPRMKAKSDAEFATLRDRYRAGQTFIGWTPEDSDNAAKLFEMLGRLGGEKVTGKGVNFDHNLFQPAAAQ